jgi:hypothetical protein
MALLPGGTPALIFSSLPRVLGVMRRFLFEYKENNEGLHVRTFLF